MIMKFKTLVAMGGVALAAIQAQAISLDFASLGSGSGIKFFAASDTFQLVNATSGANVGWSFAITASDGVGDSVGDVGNVSGVFTIGTITSGPPGFQSANVTGSGTLTIRDHASQLFQGTLTWNTIYTFNTTGGLNVEGNVNLTGITYSGVEQDLIDLNTSLGSQAIAALQFGFTPQRTLTQLTSGSGTRLTSYAGDLTANAPPPPVPDGGATIGLLSLGLFALSAVRRQTA